MKLLSLLVSLLLGAAVLLLFLRPWETHKSVEAGAEKAQQAAPASPAPATSDATAAVEAPKPKGAVANNTPQAEGSKPDEAKPAEPKKTLLAREQAEAERDAALKDQAHATTPGPLPAKRYFKVKVRDAGTLEAGLLPSKAVVIRLDGIKAREADETCKKADGSSWPCGARARAALTLLIRTRAVTCTVPPGGETGDFTARCSVMGQDLSTWLVRRGWATPQPGTEPALSEALQAAKTEHLGLWGGG
jgi:endonuclease YncB( thermonuclease family)